MGRIIGLQRRQKASSVVGTPGLDFSSARAFNVLASGTSLIAQKIKSNQAITNQVDALKEAQTANGKYREGIAQIQGLANADSTININDSIKEQTNLIDKNITEHLSGISNKRVRNLTTLKLQQDKIRTVNSINAWGLKLQGINTLTNGTETVNALSTFAGQATTFQKFEDLLAQGGVVARAVAAGLSAKQGAKFIKDTPESIAKGYLNNKLKRDPEEGLEEFRTKGIFNTIFDADEKASIEKDFLDAIDGKNTLTNYQSKLDLATTFKGPAEDPTLLDNIDWINEAEIDLANKKLLTPGIEGDLNRQRKSILKNNKLKATFDPQTLVDLSSEFAGFGLKSDGTFKDDEENFSDVFNFTMRLNQARVDGKINDTAYKQMAIPLQIAVENSARTKEADESPGLLLKAANAITPSLNREELNFRQNPTSFGINSIDSFLKGVSFKDEDKKLKVRGALINDLYFALEQRTGHVEITNGVVRGILTKAYRENSQRFGVALIPEEGLSVKVKGVKLWLMPDGTYKHRQ